MKTSHYPLIILVFVFVSFVQFNAIGQMQVQFRECLTCDTIGDISETATYYYGTAQEYQTKKIASDYGPRHLSVNNPYDWHGGVDYNSQKNNEGPNGDKGDLILAIVGGTIYWEVESNYKRIYIDGAEHDFGYGHIFRSGTGFESMRSGGCVLKKMLPPQHLRFAMLRPDGTAIGQDTGRVVVGTDTVQVSTTVAAGEVIAPTGHSGGNYAYHLHLYSFPNGSGNHFNNSDNVTKDPLEFVEHDSPKFEIQVLKTDNLDNPPFGFDPLYPGHKTSTVKVRVKLPNEGNTNTYNTVYNADSIKILMKKIFEPGSVYTPILGPDRQSLFSHGARVGTVRHNISLNKTGNWTTTGMRPYAYSDAHLRPWDDFYFGDFVTRIHKDYSGGTLRTAELPANARYPDGEYALFAQVTNVRGQVTGSDTLSFTLDNFKPYVQRVEVSRSEFYNSGSPFYIAAWEEYWQSTDWAGVGKLFFNVHQSDPIQTTSGKYLKIVAQVSEPMEDLDLVIPALEADSASFFKASSADGTEWTFLTPPFADSMEIEQLKKSVLYFRGTDLNGNTLLNLEKMRQHYNYKPLALPLRQDQADQWSPPALFTGIDTLHKFNYYDCGNELQEGEEAVERMSGECIQYSEVTTASADAYVGRYGREFFMPGG